MVTRQLSTIERDTRTDSELRNYFIRLRTLHELLNLFAADLLVKMTSINWTDESRRSFDSKQIEGIR